MKNYSRKIALTIGALLASSLWSCRHHDKGTGDLDKVQVDPSLEMVPPIAQDVQIKRVDGNADGNVLLVADFGREQIKGNYHAVEISTGKEVLRDDGKGADEVAGDGRFSVLLKEDLQTFEADLKRMRANQAKAGEQRARTFVGRELVPIDKERFGRFDLDEFKGGKLTPFIFEWKWFCKAVTDVSIEHSLLVNAVPVVEDPARTGNPCIAASASGTKAWTFGKLMSDMANTPVTGVSVEDFTRAWLSSWLGETAVNGETIPARTELFNDVIRPWVIRSGGATTVSLANWRTQPLKMEFAPFKLTAIVNRLDLRGNSAYGISNPGEGRFIFEVLDNSCNPLAGGFTVIFEYGLPIKKCGPLKEYGRSWYDLKTKDLGSDEYNAALQEVTDLFATANKAPAKPNGSALNQIRTNERAIGSPWELREFVIDPASHVPVLTTVKQEPAKKYNAHASPAGTAADVTLMAKWVNDNAADVIADRHQVPETLPSGEKFLGGKSHTEFFGFWDAAPGEILNDEARHHFSLNTCSGCHGGETGTAFLHVGTAPFGAAAPLSGFLGTITVNDPAGRPSGSPASRTFSDLARRQESLEELLCTECSKRKIVELSRALTKKPLRMTH